MKSETQLKSCTPGERLTDAMTHDRPLQVVGATTAIHALLAQRANFKAIYLSGGGVAAGSLGVPDLGISNLEDVLIDVRRIVAVCPLPLLVDADTGFGPSTLNVARTTRALIVAGAAGMHLEDQVYSKRCGHRANKSLVSTKVMIDRIKASVDARIEPSFQIMARTDGLAVEGVDATLERAAHYVDAGADMLFLEAAPNLETYAVFSKEIGVPLLANITEFGSTPLFTVEELASVGVRIALYPLSAFRAANQAADQTYKRIARDGTQAKAVELMQTRTDLYEVLDYYRYELEIDGTLADDDSARD